MTNRRSRNVALLTGGLITSAIMVFAGANPAHAPEIDELVGADNSQVSAAELEANLTLPGVETSNVEDALLDFAAIEASVATPSVLHLAKLAGISPEKVVEPPTGDQVTAIGDSLMVGAAPHLEQLLPGIAIDGRVGRPLPEGMGILDSLVTSGEARDYVVLGLATNAGVVLSQFDQIMDTIGPDRVLVLVNAWGDRSWIPGGNEQVAQAAAKYPDQVVVADWHGLIADHPEYMGPDGIHANAEGKVAYAQLVQDALNAAAELR